MKQLTSAVGLCLLLLQLACVSDTSNTTSQVLKSPAPLNLGIFEEQNENNTPFRYDTLTQSYHIAASNQEELRFISKESKEDFIFDLKLPQQELSGSIFGILLAMDRAGETPIAALQVVDGKLVFAPNTRINTSNALAVQADYIRLEYINGQAAAYYTIKDNTMRPIAIQQMDDESSLFVGIFARKTGQDLSFESIEFSHPEIEPALSEK